MENETTTGNDLPSIKAQFHIRRSKFFLFASIIIWVMLLPIPLVIPVIFTAKAYNFGLPINLFAPLTFLPCAIYHAVRVNQISNKSEPRWLLLVPSFALVFTIISTLPTLIMYVLALRKPM